MKCYVFLKFGNFCFFVRFCCEIMMISKRINWLYFVGFFEIFCFVKLVGMRVNFCLRGCNWKCRIILVRSLVVKVKIICRKEFVKSIKWKDIVKFSFVIVYVKLLKWD